MEVQIKFYVKINLKAGGYTEREFQMRESAYNYYRANSKRRDVAMVMMYFGPNGFELNRWVA